MFDGMPVVTTIFFYSGGFGIKICVMKQNVYVEHWW